MQLTLLGTAATIGILHTWMGPDHYVPFIVLARARRWSLSRTLAITTLCGVGHILGSVALGAVGIGLGLALGQLQSFEAFRADVAVWLMLGFGLTYMVWGLRRARRQHTHTHWHGHTDGTVHAHAHMHHGPHAHIHAENTPRTTTWVLFVIFIFGPCELLIPQLMVPAAQHSWMDVVGVTLVFGASTLLAMALAVTVGYLGLGRVSMSGLERYGHAVAGAAVSLCAAMMMLGL